MVPGVRVLVASLTSADQREFLLGEFQGISALQYLFNDSVNAAKFITYEENSKAALHSQKKGPKAVTGAIPIQKVRFCT